MTTIPEATAQALRGVVSAARTAPLYSLMSGVETCLRCHRPPADARHDEATCEFAALEAAVSRVDAADYEQNKGDRSQ